MKVFLFFMAVINIGYVIYYINTNEIKPSERAILSAITASLLIILATIVK